MGVASDFRSSRVEPLPQNIQVQNAYNQDDCFSHPIGGLVCDNRSKGRLFSYRNIATTQEVPEVRFRGRSLPVSGSSIRPSLVTPHIHEMHGCSSGSSTTPGHPHFKLHRRLAGSGSVSGASASTSGCRPSSSRISGVETQRQEKRSLSCSEDNVFRGHMGFDRDAGTAVSCTRRIHSEHPKEHQARPESHGSSLSESARSHGSCIHGDTFGPPAHEIIPVVAQSQGISSKGQSPEANKGYAPGASYPFYVVQTPVSDFGSHSRSVLSSQDANDRRIPHGLGSGLRWPSSPRDLERSSSRMAHQLPRNEGCISGPEILPPAVKRLPCPSAGGQHGGSLLHKSSGRTAVAPLERASAAVSALGTEQVPVPQGDLHSRAYECGSRLAVQTSCDTRGMETPPRSSQSNLGKILRSRGGPLCFKGDSTMSPLLLSDSSSSPGSGRDGPCVAQTTSLCISSYRSAPRSPGQGPSTGVSPLTDSAPLADQNMVLRSNIPPRRLAVGNSGQERSPISGTGDSISSPARALEPSCLAPEGDQLRDAGLPPDVVETILSARAPSTRRTYAIKWRVFESWCGTHHADPVHCQIVSVLEFLQEKLSLGTCPNTLRTYVAAISACHALIDGVSVGKHPLVARFIRGAKRLRPPTRATVPSWDLAIVLEGLVDTPFEPLESAPVRFLTLKMVFLTAITSLKRIGDLQALSVSPSCLDFAPGLVKAILHPHPSYLPKVPFSTINPVVLEAFCPPPFTTPEQEKLHLLCPVCALQVYVHRTSQWRKSEQLFVCYGGRNRGTAATRQTMSHWVRDAVALAYEARGQASPLGVRAHSTRGIASSMALARGAPLQQVCDAAGWSSPHTFVRFYSLDVHATPGSHVLESTSQSHVWDLFSVCAHTLHNAGGPDTSSAAALVFSFPIALSAQHRE